jgi:hypothetical protein
MHPFWRSRVSKPHRLLSYWPVLLGPLVVVVLVSFSGFYYDRFHRLQVSLEGPAPYLVATAGLLMALRWLVTRKRLYLVLAALGLAFTLREIHWDWTHKAIYVMLVMLGVWAGLWRRSLRENLKSDRRQAIWTLAAATTYVFSVIISRRVFRGLPTEAQMHRSWEELAETCAHLIFIFAALVGSWRRTSRSQAGLESEAADRAGEEKRELGGAGRDSHAAG